MTIRDLLKGSLRLIGAIASGENMSASEQADALSVLNEMLDSWAADGLMIPFVTKETFPLVVGQAVRTMGPGGNFSTTRPTEIIGASISDGSAELPIDVITIDEWRAILVKDTQSSLPQKIYPEGTNPLETINLWPIPSEVKNINIYSLKPLSQTTGLSDALIVPPGYQEAMRMNLAIRLSPEFGKPVSADLRDLADKSLATVQRKNIKPVLMVSDAIGLGTPQKPYNWIKGE